MQNPDRAAYDTADAFWPADELAQTQAFLDRGHIIGKVDALGDLVRIRAAVAAALAAALGEAVPKDVDDYLNQAHRRIQVADLNRVRLAVLDSINGLEWLRAAYYRVARSALHSLVGNELAMQRRVNLSIQMPHDESSLLPVHADVWSGDSPFEVVVWLPLVDCYGTKSMFLLPPAANQVMEAKFSDIVGVSSEDLFHAIEEQVTWVNIRYGEFLLFTQNLMHGNRVNVEDSTRWSLNCRFKSLYSPYAGKRLGEFFEPITIRAASRLGMSYEFPQFHNADASEGS